MRARALARVRHRTAFTLTDQVLSSISNFALGVIVGRNVAPDAYGVFAIGYSVYGIIIGVVRGIGTDPLIVRFSDRDHPVQAGAARAALGAVVVISLLVGAVLTGAGLLAGGDLGTVLASLGLGLVLLLVQDAYRYVFIAARRPQLAALNDAIWLVLFLAAFQIPALRHATTSAPYLGAWAVAAGLAAILAVVQSRVRPAPASAWPWLRTHADLGVRFAAEFLLVSGGPQVVLYIVAAVSGFADAGAIRGGNVLLGPAWIATTGLVAATVPEGVRLRKTSLRRLEVTVLLLGVGLAVTSMVWAFAVSMFPDALGRWFLGDTWPATQQLMIPLGVFAAGWTAATGMVAGLRALEAARRSFFVTVPLVVLLIIGGAIGAIEAGAAGAVWGMAGPAWLGAVVMAVSVHLAVQHARRTGEPAPDVEPPVMVSLP